MSKPLTIDFAQHANEIFNPLFHKLQKSKSRYVINYGGAGSGKSFTQTQHEIIRALQGKETTLVTRKFASTLKHSVIALTRRILSDWGLSELYTENKSDQVFTFTHNGSQLIFKGLDDTEKIKSIAGITRIWMEEANEFTQDDFNQLNLRLRGRENLQMTLTFNPIDENHWIKKVFFDSKEYDDSTTIIKTTYRDNRFIDDVYTQELERYQRIDPNYHRIYALGEWGVIDEARIFQNWPFAEYPEHTMTVWGLDFGYSQDPTAIVRTTIMDGAIYCDEVVYQIGLNNADIARLIKQNEYHGEVVICDSAEPKSIDDLKKFGIRAYPADKSKGSVNNGIDFLKRHTVYISPRSKNLEKENLHYKWKKDKNGNFHSPPIPEDAHNHLCDSLRYSLSLGLHDRKAVDLKGVFF